jgi:hypothetical protein
MQAVDAIAVTAHANVVTVLLHQRRNSIDRALLGSRAMLVANLVANAAPATIIDVGE